MTRARSIKLNKVLIWLKSLVIYSVHGLRVWYGGLKDVQHAVTRLVPGLRGEFLSIQDDHVL